MKVSVLIPTFNRRVYLGQALESVLAQTHTDLEILVSDDGSSDGSRELVREVAERDPRVRLLTDNPRPGIFTNMQHLIDHSSGDAFCLLGDDDRLRPEFVAELVAPLVRHPDVVASFCDHDLIDSETRLLREASDYHRKRYGRDVLEEGRVREGRLAAFRQQTCLGFAMFRSSVFCGERFDLDCGHAADVDYMLRAAELGTLYYVKRALGEYRIHPGTATSKRNEAAARACLYALAKHPATTPSEERFRRRMVAASVWTLARGTCGHDRSRSFGYLARFVWSAGPRGVPKAAALAALNLVPRAFAGRVLNQD